MVVLPVSDYSVWLIIAVTVERYVAVCRPLRAATVCRRRRAAAIMVVLVLTFLAINLHFIWTTGLRDVQVLTHLSIILTTMTTRFLDPETGLKALRTLLFYLLVVFVVIRFSIH